MYKNLKSIGITNPSDIERYSLRQEANSDTLKIYFHKEKGDFLTRSVKFKYPRQKKTVLVDGGRGTYKDTTEINPNLRFIVEELDKITRREQQEKDTKQQVLAELKHLEKVVTNKIAEIEAKLERL
ncbi:MULTISPECIES: DUF3461 family protein [unclassified Agarivorans]|uniref:DUF3461 family protein n=1 Tax=unclassified Agarivorans TaxID=2636026 RepID=UPI0010F39F59|nr:MULTISPECIES: DUF3461 family protein [unclassified Agarivorans]MDO6687367.1 DUF3461 family protein [Agarivorans sp. 3_MG-2023]MDO6717025.1 DUF3461 family protein [Agarivorans sp. 2_MG-2023]MDO6765029.1 DUF3461 family protein [Agarivorans sp. 1_MG-2023]GDY25681.1 UPF0325 protein [Agarivorans sp. Toyoura001]